MGTMRARLVRKPERKALDMGFMGDFWLWMTYLLVKML
jgi:hypothetical protein